MDNLLKIYLGVGTLDYKTQHHFIPLLFLILLFSDASIIIDTAASYPRVVPASLNRGMRSSAI